MPGEAPRRLVSRRDISVDLYTTVDGQASLEATLLDPYHLIRLRIIVDPVSRTIIAADADLAKAPFGYCYPVAGKALDLIGLKIEKGVMREVARRVGGCEGCVHLRELAVETVNFAATALIGYGHGFGLMSRDFNDLPADQKYELSSEFLRGTCRSYPVGPNAPRPRTGDEPTPSPEGKG